MDTQYLRHRIIDLGRRHGLPLVLIIEEERDARMRCVTAVKQLGYRVAVASKSSTGSEFMRVLRPDLVIADMRLRDGHSDDLSVLARAMNIPILLVSGEPTAIWEHPGGDIDIPVLQKPFHMSELQVAVIAMAGKLQASAKP